MKRFGFCAMDLKESDQNVWLLLSIFDFVGFGTMLSELIRVSLCPRLQWNVKGMLKFV